MSAPFLPTHLEELARLNRRAIGLEINPTYLHLSQSRLSEIQPTLLTI